MNRSKRLEYSSWNQMIQRCYKPTCNIYEYYGGRGIGVCARWLDFDNFRHDMGKRPSTKYSLERLNNNEGYFCGKCEECVANGRKLNCKWATRREQVRNRRTTVHVTAFGKTMTAFEWAELNGIPYKTVWARIRARGWDPERAVTTPADEYHRKGQYAHG